MPISECDHCRGTYQWHWEEAFNKYGFGDGDCQVETHNVVNGLTEAGYEVGVLEWSLHNTIIVSIKKNGIELIADGITIGYDDPREYLPPELTGFLDKEFPSETPYVF